MLKINQPLIIGRGLPFPLNCNSPVIAGDNTAFVNALIPALGVLPNSPPFELHPYKHDCPLQNFEKYIIGTFPPISYFLDNNQIVAAGLAFLRQPPGVGGRRITPPQIPFFHGNKRLMWDFLLTNGEKAILNTILQGANGRHNARNFLINFLQKNEINYADIIDSTQRNLNQQGRYDREDKNLNNICSNNDLICHLLLNPKAKYLLFNTSSIFSNSGIVTGANGFIDETANTKSFDLFVKQCQEFGLKIEIQIQSGNPQTLYTWTNISALNILQRKTKMAFEMKILNPLDNEKLNCDFKARERTFTVVTPFSPAAVNRGKTRSNHIVQNWLLNNAGQTPKDLLTLVYQDFRNNIHTPLYQMNR
jgi:hypothetical protein